MKIGSSKQYSLKLKCCSFKNSLDLKETKVFSFPKNDLWDFSLLFSERFFSPIGHDNILL